MGNALVARLLHDLLPIDSSISGLETALKELIKVGDEIVGAILLSPSGQIAVGARKGVMLATGGIGWSGQTSRTAPAGEHPALLAFSRQPNTGDGILAGERAGGEIEAKPGKPRALDAEFGDDAAHRPSPLHFRTSCWIAPSRDCWRSARKGNRFVNEANSYHDFVQGMLRSNRSPASVPAFLICDRSFIFDFGIGLIHPGYARSAALRRRRLSDRRPHHRRAWQRGSASPGEALSQTVERYNSYAESGIDEEFGRGASPLNRFNGDHGNKPNPCLRNIGPGPLLCSRGLALSRILRAARA